MTKKAYTILFVDDEPWLAESLRLSLEARGFICLSAINASEAWSILENTHVDVIVTDIMMPAGDLFPRIESYETGFHFIKRIRDKWPRRDVICLSVIADSEKIRDLKKQNVLYLKKGETPLSTVRQLIESKATGRISF